MSSSWYGSADRTVKLIMMQLRFYLIFLLILFFSAEIYAEKKLPDFHHRTDMIMTDKLLIPEQLVFAKTENGKHKVVCDTCHGIENIEDKDFKTIDKKQADFLRAGPYNNLKNFCYLCHQEEKNTADNIHILFNYQSELIEEKCLYCHTEVLETKASGEADNIEDTKLRLSAEKICYGCHLQSPHLNVLEHKHGLKGEMLDNLDSNKEKYKLKMPLGKENKIICITCHDPHQQGVVKTKRKAQHYTVSGDLQEGVSYQEHPWSEVYSQDKKDRLDIYNQQQTNKSELKYMRIKNEVLLRLPAKNGELCLVCHDFSKERKW